MLCNTFPPQYIPGFSREDPDGRSEYELQTRLDDVDMIIRH